MKWWGRVGGHFIFSLQRQRKERAEKKREWVYVCVWQGSRDGAVFHVNNGIIRLPEGEQIWGLWSNIQEEEESGAVLEFEKC